MAIATTTSSARVLGFVLALAMLGAPLALAPPARAESPAECQGMFQSADLNGDATLSGAEIAASDDIDGDLASAFGNNNAVTLPEFMAACRD
jgi:hypothetical protein